jgi:glycosyltransferase involved in cell wall biosynthesis
MNDLPKIRRGDRTRAASVIVAIGADTVQPAANECLASVQVAADTHTSVEQVPREVAAVNAAIERLAPADILVVSAPCRLGASAIKRLREAAASDTNIASASALAEAESPLGLGQALHVDEGFTARADSVAERSRRLRPRLSRAVGPCIYLRRDALELVGPLDETLELIEAIELDFSQRCVLCGLTHVAADDVLVRPLAPPSAGGERGGPSTVLRERYPYLDQTPLADSGVLGYALHSARGPQSRLPVTFDARALDGAITGTHVHVLELILALARTDQLELRVLIRAERIERDVRALLESLAHTELLAAEQLDRQTPRTAVFHRPQQTFSPGDVALALALGERFVLSQLDLIAYRNPGYFHDAARWQDYRAASRHGLAAAERVVVFSEHTREELVADALVDPERLEIVAPGLDHRATAEPLRPGGLDGGLATAEFLLCLGTDFRHKNRVFALRLLAALRERHGWDGGLVLAGTHISPGSSAELERDYLREHEQLARAVVSLGPVGERERTWLFEHASAIVYPSVYEGFGLVPFESALAGVPCLFSPQASLADAAPDGTATIVPWDPVASAAQAYTLLTDARARARHVESLAARARSLTWDATAAAMVEIYRQAAAAPVRVAATLSRDLVQRERRLSVQHEEEVARLIGEREHAKGMYDALNAEVGFGLSLIGPHGTLPEPLQRALLALGARPALSRPLFAALSGVFLAMRALTRPLALLRRRPR